MYTVHRVTHAAQEDDEALQAPSLGQHVHGDSPKTYEQLYRVPTTGDRRQAETIVATIAVPWADSGPRQLTIDLSLGTRQSLWTGVQPRLRGGAVLACSSDAEYGYPRDEDHTDSSMQSAGRTETHATPVASGIVGGCATGRHTQSAELEGRHYRPRVGKLKRGVGL